MKRCLVIGGNGFIGSYVVDALVAAGYEVTVFDRFSSLLQFSQTPSRLIAGDFLNLGELAAAIEGQQIVYHLLSTTNPASAEADPLFDVRTNITGSIELFRLAAEHGVEHVYFASTGGAIYGEQSEQAVTEDVVPEPVSPYAIGKLTVERYLHYFRRTRGLESTTLRLSNPYGPRQHRNRRQGVIPIFLRNLSRGEPLTVFGDGSMVRDYIYVEDMARMVVTPLERPSPHQVYNVGSGITHSVSDILAAIVRVTGRQPSIVHQPVPPTFVNHIALNTDRFRRTFGDPGPLVDLDEGIRRTWLELTGR